MNAYKQCHFIYRHINNNLLSSILIPLRIDGAQGFRKYYSPLSDLCADVYGLRNLIVQMGHKDDVSSRGEVARGRGRGDNVPAAVSAASRVFALAHVSSLKY